MTFIRSYILFYLLFLLACNKNTQTPEPPAPFTATSLTVNDRAINNGVLFNIHFNAGLKVSFSAPIDQTTGADNILLNADNGAAVPFNLSYSNNDSTFIIQPASSLSALTKYTLSISTGLRSKQKSALASGISIKFVTAIDSTDKFPRLNDDALLDLVQRQTFKYFWDFGHPVSGLARERNTSGNLVTSGGSGFGIMAIIVATHRQFITRTEGLTRLQKIVDFLKNKTQTFHGAYPHWLDGATGNVIPFSAKDNGADLVETSYLIQGLLCARQYFNNGDAAETSLRSDINQIWNRVEWNWFRKNNENVLYWHWSPNYNWDMNVQIRGWNECLITYVLAASSSNYSIPKEVYDNGWAANGGMKNGNSYYSTQLPLGPSHGGPLFFAHYSFLGINPTNLTDTYADYWEQNTAHTKINYTYCVSNPKGYNGYSNLCWGLTASDDNLYGYAAHSPTNDDGVISPTAAISSFPYTPAESMNALQFFYYKLGDKLWKEYGFIDAFNLSDVWFSNSFLAIDQGPEIIMIENHRSGLLWNLFMSCPEVKQGMKKLGFQSPYL